MTDHVHHPETEAEHPDTALVESKVNSGMPNLYDILFLVFLMGMLAMVAWVGVLSHEEGIKNEVTKQNGEAWVKWMKANSEARTKDDFEVEACTASTTERKRWGDCFNALLESEKTLKGLINPFTKEPVNFVAKCDPKELWGWRLSSKCGGRALNRVPWSLTRSSNQTPNTAFNG